MGYNRNTTDTYYYVSDENMFLRKRINSWDTNDGKGDSIGRTVLGYIAYGDRSLMKSVMNCFMKIPCPELKAMKRGYYWHGYRYPDYWEDDLSRDHLSYTIIGLKYVGANKLLKDFVLNQRWRISKKYTFSADLWLWSRGVIGKKWARALYYIVMIPMMTGAVLWSRALYWLGAFGGEMHQDDFRPSSPEDLTKVQLKCRKLMFPTYALHNLAWQLSCLPGSRAKKVLKRICLRWTGRHNYLLRILFGDRSEKLVEQCKSYRPMSSWSWSTRLDGTNDRATKILTKKSLIEFNSIDQDILRVALNIEGMT